MVASKRKASVETRQRLLQTLGVAEGSVVIARRPTDDDDVIEVRMNSSGAVPQSRRPETFDGFRVDYQVVKVPKAGQW